MEKCARLLMTAAVVVLSLAASATPIGADKVHDLLPKYGLPAGLLPDAVKSYSLSDDGTFEIQLSSSSCYVHFPSNLVYLDSTIKGDLSYGRISNLSGIQAKKLFLWVTVTAIVAHPDQNSVEFQVGFLSQSLPDSEFQSIPRCKSSVACRGAPNLLSDS
ncbi:hypothetical protein LUZ63_016021 [Rhynchospora breviuscula]|uniref:Uncharacterized protein n=1 Tax=Rhynchospora breviuscula TaxID=2022672 RepID=A0A9Q0CDF5_9POAL|nr:hypothetical protein LUZ63_016021 [Rhynchospora breviuscula]